MLGMVQLNAAEGMQGQSPTMIKNFKIGMSVLAVAIIPFSYLLPKVCTAFFGVLAGLDPAAGILHSLCIQSREVWQVSVL